MWPSSLSAPSVVCGFFNTFARNNKCPSSERGGAQRAVSYARQAQRGGRKDLSFQALRVRIADGQNSDGEDEFGDLRTMLIMMRKG